MPTETWLPGKEQRCWLQALNKFTSLSNYSLLVTGHSLNVHCEHEQDYGLLAYVILWCVCPLQLPLLLVSVSCFVATDNATGLGTYKDGQNELKGIALLLEEYSINKMGIV